MRKIALVTYAEHQTPADRGKMAHVLNLGEELVRADGVEVAIVFAGKSVEWLPQLTNANREAEHPFIQNYGDRFDAIRPHVRACNFCCKRFKTTEAVEGAGIPILGEGSRHLELSRYVLDGWEIITV